MVETQIIANLGGQLTPDIISAINSPTNGNIICSFIIVGIGLAFLIGFVSWIFGKVFTKSGEYRKLLVDMYVVGMIKKFAKEDNVDIIAEVKEFEKMQNKKDRKLQDIDNVIADNLKEKVNAKAEKDIKNIEED